MGIPGLGALYCNGAGAEYEQPYSDPDNGNENGDVGIQFEVPKRTASAKRKAGRRQQQPQSAKGASGGGGGGAGGGSVPGGGGGGGGSIQLISLPQLDQIQRALKVLDVRLLHLNTLATEEDRLRQDIEHVLHVISENQKALDSVVKVLVSLQEEVRSLGTTIHRHQATNFQVLPPPSGHRKRSGGGDHPPLKTDIAGQTRKNSKTSQ